MIWNTHTNPQTHTLTHTDAVVRQTRTHAHVRAWERNILPTINGRQKQEKRREIRSSRRGDHRPRQRKKKPGESSSGNKTVFSLPAVKRGPAERQRASDLRPEAPRLRSPSHSSLLPAVSFFSTHLTCSTSPLLLPKKGSPSDIISTPLLPRSQREQRGWRSLRRGREEAQQSML